MVNYNIGLQLIRLKVNPVLDCRVSVSCHNCADFWGCVCLTKCVFVGAKLGGSLGFHLLVYLVEGKHDVTMQHCSVLENRLLKGFV